MLVQGVMINPLEAAHMAQRLSAESKRAENTFDQAFLAGGAYALQLLTLNATEINEYNIVRRMLGND